MIGGGCATDSAGRAPASAVTTAGAASPRVGADRDAHGCIGSAGYRWCGRTARCERPWELAAAAGFANEAAAFEAFCAAP